jgi:hypothetical protein
MEAKSYDGEYVLESLGRFGIRRTSLKIPPGGSAVLHRSAAMRWQEDEDITIQTSRW